jgi:hypothetical protein
MRFVAAFLVVLLLVGGESQAQPGRVLPAVDSLAPTEDSGDVIWYEVRVWGTIRYTWRIGRGGEGRIRAVNEPERVFAASEDDFNRVHATLDYADLAAMKREPCEPGPTDGPYGSVNWRIDGVVNSIPWTTSERCANMAALYSRIDSATKALRNLAER